MMPLPLLAALAAIACTSSSSDTGGDGGTADGGATDGGATDGGATDGGATDGGTAGQGLALLSLNLRCFRLDGTPYPDTAARLAAIAQAAASHGVAVLAVQEACRNEAEGDAMARLAAALEEASGQPWGTAWTATHLAWEGTADEAEEGVGVLVRGVDPQGEGLESTVLEYAVQGALTRRTLAVDLPAELGGLRVHSVHLDFEDAQTRRLQARQTAVAALVGRPDLAVLLAGDWNATAGSEPLLDLTAAGFHRLSTAADPDGAGIDHVFAPAGGPWQVTDSRLLFDDSATAVSDHPGLLVQLSPTTGSPPTLTRLVAQVDAGWGHHLAVRGDAAPLDWTLGWPAVSTADATWEAAFLGWEGTVAYKWLLDDSTWESGDDHVAQAGAEEVVSPSFNPLNPPSPASARRRPPPRP